MNPLIHLASLIRKYNFSRICTRKLIELYLKKFDPRVPRISVPRYTTKLPKSILSLVELNRYQVSLLRWSLRGAIRPALPVFRHSRLDFAFLLEYFISLQKCRFIPPNRLSQMLDQTERIIPHRNTNKRKVPSATLVRSIVKSTPTNAK